MTDFSVVIPVFNSEKFIERIYNELIETFSALRKSFEVIFVDDASSDGSVAKITALQKKHPGIRLVRLKKNFGQYIATACGISYASSGYIITMDADGTPPPNSIATLLNQSVATDELIYAEPVLVQRSSFRKTGSKVFDAIVRTFVKSSIDLSRHSGSSMRMIKKELAEEALGNLTHPVLLDITLMNLARENIRFVQVDFETPVAASSYSNIKLIRQGCVLLFATLTGRLNSKSTINPAVFIREDGS